MRGLKAEEIPVTDLDREELDRLSRAHTTPQQIALRARIVLSIERTLNQAETARQVGVSEKMVRQWRRRWASLFGIDRETLKVEERLEDAPRPGAPPKITAEQYCQMEVLACEAPSDSGRPISQWTARGIADEVIRRGIVPEFSRLPPGSKGGLQPHRFRYWLTKVSDEQREEKIAEGCWMYTTASERAKEGERTISSDEITGVQALERKYPDLPMQPGHVLRREFEYVWMGLSHVSSISMWLRGSCGNRRAGRLGKKRMPSCISSLDRK